MDQEVLVDVALAMEGVEEKGVVDLDFTHLTTATRSTVGVDLALLRVDQEQEARARVVLDLMVTSPASFLQSMDGANMRIVVNMLMHQLFQPK